MTLNTTLHYETEDWTLLVPGEITLCCKAYRKDSTLSGLNGQQDGYGSLGGYYIPFQQNIDPTFQDHEIFFM